MVTGPYTIDRLVKGKIAPSDVQRVSSVRPKTQKDVVDTSKRPVPKWSHALCVGETKGVFSRGRSLRRHGRPPGWPLRVVTTRSARRVRVLANGMGHSFSPPHPTKVARSVRPVFPFPNLTVAFRRRPRRVKLRRLCWQVHGHQNLLGDGFALDQGDQAERSLAFLANGLDPEHPAEEIGPPNVLGSALALVVASVGWRRLGSGGKSPGCGTRRARKAHRSRGRYGAVEMARAPRDGR